MRFGIDANILIYFLDTTSPWHERAVGLFKLAERGGYSVIASELLIAEVLSKPGMTQEDITAAQDVLANLPLGLQPLTRTTLLAAARLRREHGLKLPDALHLASAMTGRADYFVTNDQALLRLRLPRLRCRSLGNALDAA